MNHRVDKNNMDLESAHTIGRYSKALYNKTTDLEGYPH